MLPRHRELLVWASWSLWRLCWANRSPSQANPGMCYWRPPTPMPTGLGNMNIRKGFILRPQSVLELKPLVLVLRPKVHLPTCQGQ